MMINKKLDIDKDIELLENGTLCHASNIVINNSNDGILSENSIEKKISLETNELIVGYIACSDEFIIFTNNNRIIRINSKDYSQKVIQTNWKWQGGKIIGCYTYNVNQELIISISEQIDYEQEKVPLKIINLDKPNYKENDSDDKYTLAPEIPKCNLLNYEYINGTSIYKGVYVFFIRYKLDTDYTAWFKLGYPINIYNTNHKETVFEGRIGYIDVDKEKIDTYSISEQCDDDAVNITKNIKLGLEITVGDIKYNKYQIGYIVTDIENNTHVFTTLDYDINNKIVIIDNKNNDDISVDEMTRDAFQIFNAKTLCNYGNRVYLANYNEENLNIEVPNIDVSAITVNAVKYKSSNAASSSINTETYTSPEVTVRSVDTKTLTANRINTPETFKVGKGYYVEMHINWKDDKDSYPVNIKLFCTRIATINDKNYLLVKVADLLHAVSAYLTKDTYNTNITFNVSYNPSLTKECKFIAIAPYNNGYDVEFISDNIEIYTNKYNDTTQITYLYATGSGIDVTKPCIGQKTDVRANIATGLFKKADIEYDVPTIANDTGDIFVTSITEFDTTVDALNTIELDWFYNGKFKLDNVEYSTHGAYSGNSCYSNPWNTSYPIVNTSGDIINYKARKAFNFNILDDSDFIYNKLVETYPNCTFKFLLYCINEDGSASDKEIRTSIEDNIYDKTQISLGYNKVAKEYNLIKIDWNNSRPNAVIILKNEFYVVDTSAKETKHNITDIFSTIEYINDRKNYNIDNLINYWNNGGDAGYVTTYKWSDDREPTNDEWQLSEKYNIEWGKYVTTHNAEQGSEDIINRMYSLYPIAVGYQNITEDDVTHIITVDKDFAIAVPVYKFINQLGKYPNILDSFELRLNDIDTVLKEGILSNFYVLFRKQDVTTYYNKQVTGGIVAYLREETAIDSEVPVFDKLYDFSFDPESTANSYTLPSFNNVESTSPVLSTALFYINRTSQGDFDLDDSSVNSEYKKTAINNAVYNFFIHFVYPNGNYTSGIRIPNNRTYSLSLPVATCTVNGQNETFSYTCDEDTTVNTVKNAFNDYVTANNAKIISYDTTYGVYRLFDCQDNLRICNVYPVFDDTGISVYINSKGEKLFRGYPKDKTKPTYIQYNESIKFRFDNIPQPNGFIGYFISYEKPEHILIGTGPVIPYSEGENKESDFNSDYNGAFTQVRFYYPEFNVLKKAGGINIVISRKELIGGLALRGQIFTDYYDIRANKVYEDNAAKSFIAGVESSDIISPNDASNSNGGREGVLRINFKNSVVIKNNKFTNRVDDRQADIYLTQAIGLSITDNIYLNENKELISLGFIKYYDNKVTNNQYGYDDYPYNYDYYKCNASVYAFNKRGIIFNEVDSIPRFFDNNDLIYPNYPVLKIGRHNVENRQGNTPICRYNYDIYCESDLNAKQIDNAPIEHYYTLKKDDDDATNNDDIINVRTVYTYPLYINDLFKISSCYNTFIDKIIVNYNKELYYNFITYYGKTIRRSDVMSDESVENRWRIFRPEEYKIIDENKGNITNVVGIGVYLFAHCEHSLFVFNRDNTMRTEDKDVQLIIPDAFDIDYSEVFTSNKGYAGLQDFNQWCISNYGYVFFDKDSKKLYRFDNNSIDDLSIGLINLFKCVEYIKFAIDSDNQRLICIGAITSETNDNKFTISYSFLTKTWISSHSYWYENLFNTKDKVFFILNTNNEGSIHSFTDSFNKQSFIITDESNVFKTELIENNPASFIDVVFNNNGIDKVLDYVSYRINKATDDTYSGNKMLIYTNVCYSDYMDISKPRKSVMDYKNPVFRFGIWVYNWFRNKVLKINTINPIIRGNGKFALNENELGKCVDNALIVGKYFVVRLIFRDENKRISIDDIQCY